MIHGALFFFNDTATTEIYTLSLHDALPIFDKKQIVHSHLNQFFNFFDHAFGTADTELGFANITEGASRRASSRCLDGEELSAFANNMLVARNIDQMAGGKRQFIEIQKLGFCRIDM